MSSRSRDLRVGHVLQHAHRDRVALVGRQVRHPGGDRLAQLADPGELLDPLDLAVGQRAALAAEQRARRRRPVSSRRSWSRSSERAIAHSQPDSSSSLEPRYCARRSKHDGEHVGGQVGRQLRVVDAPLEEHQQRRRPTAGTACRKSSSVSVRGAPSARVSAPARRARVDLALGRRDGSGGRPAGPSRGPRRARRPTASRARPATARSPRPRAQLRCSTCAGARLGLLDDPLGLLVDDVERVRADRAQVLQRGAEEDLAAGLADRHRAQARAHAEARDHRARELGRGVEVVADAPVELLAELDQLGRRCRP